MDDDKILKIVKGNLQYIMNTNKLTHQDVIDCTGESKSNVSKYLNEEDTTFPSVLFLVKLAERFNISLEKLITISLYQEDEYFYIKDPEEKSLSLKRYDDYIGTYLTYYFETDQLYSTIVHNKKEEVQYGVLTIMKDSCMDKTYREERAYKVKALFSLNKEEAKNLKIEIDKLDIVKDVQKIKNRYAESKRTYDGNIQITKEQVFISLMNQDWYDKALLILYNPPSGNQYLGGLGTVNSASRGRLHMPCIQYLLMSRESIERSKEELSKILFIAAPEVEAGEETKKMINLFKKVYGDDEVEGIRISEEQKQLIMQTYLESIIKDQIEKNACKYGKISSKEDDECYHIIREFCNKE